MTSLSGDLSVYIAAVNRIRATQNATEHSYRAAFAKFVEAQRPDITLLNEPQRIVKLGAPDYEVRRGDGLIGRIEVKDVSTPHSPLRMTASDRVPRRTRVDS